MQLEIIANPNADEIKDCTLALMRGRADGKVATGLSGAEIRI